MLHLLTNYVEDGLEQRLTETFLHQNQSSGTEKPQDTFNFMTKPFD